MQMPYFCQLWTNASSTCIFHILKMIPNKQLYLVFLFGALEDAYRPVIASCFSFYGTWRCLQLGDCILLFFLWHLKMLAAWWLHLVFLSMALEDVCCLVITSCFSFYGTWRFFFLWQLRMLAAWWLHLAFLSMALEDACCLVIASCFSFYGTWRCLLSGDCILFFLSMALEDACSLISVSLSCFLCKLKILPYKYLHLQFAFLWSADTFLSQISSS